MTDAATTEDPTVEWVRAWGAALNEVELGVEEAEKLLGRLHHEPDSLPDRAFEQDWVAPNLPGPVPEQFADRARRLLQRQVEVSTELGQAIVYARSQSRVINKLEQAERRPVFLDTAV